MLSRLLRLITAKRQPRLIAGRAHSYAAEAASEADVQPHAIEQFSLVNTRRFGLMLQRVVREPAAQYHSHPWSALVICLSGGYQERYLCAGLTPAERTAPRIRKLSPSTFHMITGVRPDTWMLVLRGPIRSDRAFVLNLVGDQADCLTPRPREGAPSAPAPDQLVVQ